ncbi:LTA synthase family protein [Pedobacter metabolipauper]|uniref:Phosphoglycerol transferase MdoB-like AlkP superfamily enzyme n=1 Tax=Pedobacter metabolipauper TaxID=425513 RepID=A0A4V3D1G7_9SPHI|nr:LTA synthase family protein [Pedobacter metabolipauper]TDQ11143.1 phosphoglycerol transferase MdoB-like AlkP superfamily enzyme [Pedobacter metabolipauper]
MLKSTFFFARFILFWLVFFFLDRFLFLIINSSKIARISYSEILATFYHALLLDISMIAYLLIIPLISYIYWLLNGRKVVNLNWLPVYNKILIVLFSLISVVNFNIYREWGSKINAKALGFAIYTPNEALASSASSPIALSISILALIAAMGFFLQNRIILKNIKFEKSPVWFRGIISILLIGITFLMMRGGFYGAPINQSMAYFSKEQILNHAAVNTEWNLISSVLAAKKTKSNPYLYLDKQQAALQVKDLYAVKKDTTIHILNTERPNIVLFIVESFTADLTKTLGNENGITPSFDSLISKGVLFSKIYSSGNRTDKGFIATLSGFPTLAAVNIVKWPEKTQKLPSIAQSLYKNGYHNSFFYGGESEFDNYKAFILSHDYQKLIDKNDYKGGQVTSWGQFDGAVLKRQLQEIKTEKQPFFSTILTLTNHEPFALPGQYKFGTSDNIAKFKSTAYYTDSCINAYLNAAKKESWYKNTLFIFIADHGHVYPKNIYDIYVPQRYHVPLLFYGDVIKDEFKGKKFNNIGSQTDIAATLLAQLNISNKEFIWSKNLLNPYVKPFAFFSWDNGMGFINNEQSVTFDNVGKMILYNSHVKDEAQTSKTLTQAKSYLQSVYEKFIEL